MNLFGHPVHPMLVPLPIGAFVFALVSLAVYVFGRDAFWLGGAYWLTIAGVATALTAAVAGFLDWLGVPGDSPNKNIGAWHLALNLTLVTLFFASWLFLGGFGGPAVSPDPSIPLLLQVTGILLLGVSGWLGGEMVYGTPAKQGGQEQPKHEELGLPAA